MAAGIECPRCGCRHAPVTQTRTASFFYRRRKVLRIRRRRTCRHCGWNFTTIELEENESTAVVDAVIRSDRPAPRDDHDDGPAVQPPNPYL